MGSKFLAHLRRQWMGALALFLVLTGGTAYAANTVFSSDIVNNEVYSADVRNDTLAGGGLTAGDLRSGAVATAEINDGAVRTADVQNEALTGADIKDQSGVDTCPDGSERLGELCVRVANLALIWSHALHFCGDLELHLPSLGEAISLASNHDIPGVDSGEIFWTDGFYSSDQNRALAVEAGGEEHFSPPTGSTTPETVCVRTPTN